jgi:hypothetical protein
MVIAITPAPGGAGPVPRQDGGRNPGGERREDPGARRDREPSPGADAPHRTMRTCQWRSSDSSARTPFAASNCPAALPPARISRPNSGGEATTNAAHVPVATDPYDYDNGDEVGHRRRAHRRRSAARCRPASGHCGPAVDGDIAVGRDRTAHADAANATSGTVAAACACAAATASSRVTAVTASSRVAAIATIAGV